MMKINRENYEAWLLDMAEGNLSTQDKAELMAFIDANPDLKETIDLSEKNPELSSDTVVFENKKNLYRGNLNEQNIEWYLAVQAEDDTSAEENTAIEEFLEQYPCWKKHQHLFSLSKLSVDDSIRFEHKSTLHRIKTVSIFQRRVFYYAAAAAMAIVWTSAYLYFEINRLEELTTQNTIPKAATVADEPLQNINTSNDSIRPSGNPEQERVKEKKEESIPDSVKPFKPVYRIIENRPLMAGNSRPEPVEQNKSLEQTEVASVTSAAETSVQFEKLNSLRHEIARLIAENPNSSFLPGAFDKLIERMADGETDISNSDLPQLLVNRPPSHPVHSVHSKTPLLDALAWSFNKISGKDVSIEKKFDEDGRMVAYELDAGLFKIGKEE